MGLLARVQSKAFNTMKENISPLISDLRKSEEGLDYISFRGPAYVEEIVFRQVIEKRLLGRVFKTSIEGHFEAGLSPATVRLKIHGILVKKGVTFEGDDELSRRLNSNNRLLSLLQALDIEQATVSYDFNSEKWRAAITPYGGSYVWIMIPPLSYNVRIREDELRGILKCIEIIAKELKK
jgi:hypothetical protein